MSTTQSFKNLTSLSQSIGNAIEKLNSGSLTLSEVQQLLEDSRELHERVAILQYALNSKNVLVSGTSKEIEISPKHKSSILNSKVSAQLDESKSEVTPPKEKKGFKLNFNLFTPEPEPTNQINLLDVIEEESPLTGEVSLKETPKERVEIQKESVIEVKKDKSMDKVIAKVSEKQVVSLNDKLADANDKPTLAAKLSRKPIKDLNEEIGLNQKFLFMNDLFGGENTLYKEAIASINNFLTFNEADQLMNQLAQRHNWDIESVSVTKFKDLVERRFL